MATNLRRGGRCAPWEEGRDGGLVLLDPQAFVAHTDAIAPETLADRLQQNEMQRAAVDEKLGPVIAREHAARLAVNELAMPVVERQLTRRHRCLC
jgi:hypothetical protein